MEVGKAKKIDRAKILARIARRQSSKDAGRADLGDSSSGSSFKRLLHPHSTNKPKHLPRPWTLALILELEMSEGDGSEHHSWAKNGDGLSSSIGDFASEGMTTHSNDKFCPDWNIKNSDFLFTRGTVVEMMSHLVLLGDMTAVTEANSNALSSDGYHLLAKVFSVYFTLPLA